MNTPSSRAPVSAFVITFNEEDNLPQCLASLTGWVDEVFIVDSYSTDGTRAVAEKFGAKVVQNRFLGHGAQRNWAMKNLPLRNEWVLALDADQSVTPELANKIREALQGDTRPINGFYVRRRQIFRGSWIRHGSYYPVYMLKLFRAGTAKCDEIELDDKFYVEGRTEKLEFDIVEDNVKEQSISFWIQKHNDYAVKQAQDEIRWRRGERKFLTEPKLFGTPTERTLWLKLRWYKMPLYWRPFFFFFYRYIFRMGFLDGKQGFIFHFLQAFWFRLLVDIKIEEMQKQPPAQLNVPKRAMPGLTIWFAFFSLLGWATECDKDARKLCPGQKAGKGLERCLLEQAKSLDAGCRNLIKKGKSK